EKVRERLERAARVLSGAGIPYAVSGGNAVRFWVAQVDETAVRNTRDVHILLRRSDWEAAKSALAEEGFIYRHTAGVDMFLDGPAAKARDAVHVVFANEKVREEYVLPAPDVDESERSEGVSVLSLEALARMKLTSFRDRDRVHLRDMLDVGLLDETWRDRFPRELAVRLQELIDHPDG
ncbi:MAG: hypothetical protein ACRDGR_11265, partial [bacterium]